MLRARAQNAAAGGAGGSAGDDGMADVAKEIEIMARVAHPNIGRLHEVIGEPETLALCPRQAARCHR